MQWQTLHQQGQMNNKRNKNRPYCLLRLLSIHYHGLSSTSTLLQWFHTSVHPPILLISLCQPEYVPVSVHHVKIEGLPCHNHRPSGFSPTVSSHSTHIYLLSLNPFLQTNEGPSWMVTGFLINPGADHCNIEGRWCISMPRCSVICEETAWGCCSYVPGYLKILHCVKYINENISYGWTENTISLCNITPFWRLGAGALYVSPLGNIFETMTNQFIIHQTMYNLLYEAYFKKCIQL